MNPKVLPEALQTYMYNALPIDTEGSRLWNKPLLVLQSLARSSLTEQLLVMAAEVPKRTPKPQTRKQGP